MADLLPAVTDADFDEVVRSADGLLVVDVWAAWCPPCRALEPVLAELAADLDGALAVVALDSDANPEVARRYGVMNLPTMLVFRDGELVQRLVGARGKRLLLEALAPVLDTGAPTVPAAVSGSAAR